MSGKKVQPSPEDIRDAVSYVNAAAEWNLKPSDLHFVRIMQISPIAFVEDPSYVGWPGKKSGWLLQYPKQEWLNRLNAEYDGRGFDHILDFYERGNMPPGIQIDGEMGDGMGRAMFHYALGLKTMPVAAYASK